MIHQRLLLVTNGFRFTIGCDYCNDWFHGSCVGISIEEASSIEAYKCPTCCKECIEDPFYIEGINSFT